jgi:hypothetical protein
MPQDRRHVTGFRRIRLSNGRYLQVALLDKPGPRGGHTVGYIRTGKGGERIYPGHLKQPRGASAGGTKRRHGRQTAAPVPKRARRLVVKRKTSGR